MSKNSVAASSRRDNCDRRIGRSLILIQPVRMMLVSVPRDVNGVGVLSSPGPYMTVTIRNSDLIDSVADALQYISYFHPMDYIRALGKAYELEQGPAAKDAIAQILTNSRMCAEGHRPICQDTGIVTVFVKWGQDCRLESPRSLQQVVDEGVRRAFAQLPNFEWN